MATTTSSYGGRIQCILLSTLDGYVIYERFYDQFNDIQKAEIRTSFDEAVGSHDVVHGLEVVGRFKYGVILCPEIWIFSIYVLILPSMRAGMERWLDWCLKKSFSLPLEQAIMMN
jgi:hypothetical protein